MYIFGFTHICKCVSIVLLTFKINLIYMKRIIFFFNYYLLIMFLDFIYVEQYILFIGLKNQYTYLFYISIRFKCHKTILAIFYLKIIVVFNIC